MNPKINYQLLDQQHLWHPYTKQTAILNSPFPIITKAAGIYLYDNEGKQYFDAVSSWWASNLGHCHPKIVTAIQQQAETLDHSILGNMTHTPAIKLADALVKLMPDPNYYAFFGSDGASAIEAALKIALQYWYNKNQPRRNKFLSLTGNYHGDTLGAVGIGLLPNFHAPFAQAVIPSLKADAPSCHTCTEKDNNHCTLTCFHNIETIITSRSEDIAAVIVEPLCQCAGGMNIYSAAYLEKLAKLCQTHGVLLIVDEIAVGFGRTGKMFAFEHANIQPDIVCLGKGLSGGHLPISVTLARKEIYQTFNDVPQDNTFYHGHTFAGNPICAAAALATLQIYSDENIVKQAKQKGEILANTITQLKSVLGIENIRTLGMIAAFNVKSPELANNIKLSMLQKNVLIRPLGNVIYLMPPLVTPDETLKKIINLLVETIKSIQENLLPT